MADQFNVVPYLDSNGIRFPRIKVASTNIKSIGYCPMQRVLEIEFRDGSVAQYFGIPQEVTLKMMSEKSKGKFYEKCIKGHWDGRVNVGEEKQMFSSPV